MGLFSINAVEGKSHDIYLYDINFCAFFFVKIQRLFVSQDSQQKFNNSKVKRDFSSIIQKKGGKFIVQSVHHR